jgi:hypothetical protein
MEMVEIVNPTLDEYMARVRHLSEVYGKGSELWYELTADDIPESDDRDEFSFIKMALWDKLLEKEFFPPNESRTQLNLFNECNAEEPGEIPGSSFWSAPWELTNTQNSLIAC